MLKHPRNHKPRQHNISGSRISTCQGQPQGEGGRNSRRSNTRKGSVCVGQAAAAEYRVPHSQRMKKHVGDGDSLRANPDEVFIRWAGGAKVAY